MKKASLYLLPISLCLLSPLCSEGYEQEYEESGIHDQQDSDQLAHLDDEQQTQTAPQQHLPKQKRVTVQKQQRLSSPSNKITQQQGKATVYDRNVRRQNHPGAQRQVSGKNTPAARQKIAGSPRSSSASSIAQSEDQMTGSSQQPSTPPSMLQTPMNQAARPPLTNGLNLFVIGEALLWQATEENLDYAYRTNLTGTADEIEYKALEFNWDWGFRVGLGYNMPRDGWDIGLFWTHIENHAKGHQKFDADADLALVNATWSILPVGGIGEIQSAHSSWKVNLDQVDFILGKEYYAGKFLTLRPFAGVRADWIYQRLSANYYPVSSLFNPEYFTMHNRFFGFGFLGGIDSDWMLGQGFSIFGNADFAILLGFFDVDQNASNVSETGNLTKGALDRSFRCGRGVLDINLGLKWCHLFSKQSWGLTFKAGYEYHLFFDQNQFNTPTAPSLYVDANGDLTYQGATLSGQLDF